MPEKIVLATSNPGKVAELKALLKAKGFEIIPQSEFKIADARESGLTFIENAILKARNAAKYTGFGAIADDSGIEVDALNGKPGIYSARFAGTHGDSEANNTKLLHELKDLPDAQRTARFRCVMVYMQHAEDPSPLIGEGSWEGRILHEKAGTGGFGYDPVFFVPEYNLSAAELTRKDKNRISHRAKALAALVAKLEKIKTE